MSKKTSNKEWELAESVANTIQKNIHTYYMESVIPSNSIYIKVDVLVPMTENISMTFSIDVPHEMMDCGNNELLEYFKQKICPSFTGEYLTEMPANFSLPSLDNVDIEMNHIMEEHSARGRILTVLKKFNKSINPLIKKDLSLNDNEYEKLKNGIIDKFNSNGTLNHREKEVVDAILRRDPQGEDVFPYHMSRNEIQTAIQEAYNDAKNIHDKRERASKQPNHFLYNGKSKNGMVIEFRFDFQTNTIVTAYPK